MEHKSDRDKYCIWCARENPQRSERLRNQIIRGDNPDYNIIKIGQNTEKCPTGLRRLAFT